MILFKLRPHSKLNHGFTAVELLATLFIAAMFLVAGYQLFNLVIQDGGDIRAEAGASNLAYSYLRKHSISEIANPCVAKTVVSNEDVTIEGAADAKVSVTINCPQSDALAINRIEATVSYGVGPEAKSIKQATFIDASTGASPTNEITNSLIGWWPLNGNGNGAVGNLNGVASGTTNTTGQNGKANNALAFSGSSSMVTIPIESLNPRSTGPFTISAWVKFNTMPSTKRQVIASTTEAGGWSFTLLGTDHSTCPGRIMLDTYIGGTYRSNCSTSTPALNTWIFAVGVYDGNYTRLYLNGALNSSLAVSGTFSWPALKTVPLCLGSEPGSTSCNQDPAVHLSGHLDDARLYSRALSASEVLQLYNAGAK